MRLYADPVEATPTDIKLHQVSRIMEIQFDDGRRFELPYEYLRVFTPSAEAVGHGPGQEVLQTGKENVYIMEVRPVGNYGIAPTFSDGHNTGIYTWDLLYKLGSEYETLWPDYLRRLEAEGYKRNETSKN